MERFFARPFDLSDGRQIGRRLGWALFILTVVSNGVQILLALWIGRYHPALADSQWCVMGLVVIGLYGCGLPVFRALVRRLPAPPPARKELTKGQFVRCWLLCIFLAYLCNMLGTGLNALVDRLLGTSSTNPAGALISMSGILPTLLVAGICSPIVEEYIFRGLLLRRALVFGEKAACVFTAAAFALMHMNLYQFFYAFAIGLVLARLAVYTGSIRSGAGIHILINLWGGVLMPALSQMPGVGLRVMLSLLLAAFVLGGWQFFRLGRLIFTFPPREAEGEADARPAPALLWRNSGTCAFLLLCLAGLVYAILAA